MLRRISNATATFSADQLPAIAQLRNNLLANPGAQIGAIVRDVQISESQVRKDVIIPHHDTVIETDDHVIVFVPKKRMVRQVEKLFQVGATFF